MASKQGGPFLMMATIMPRHRYANAWLKPPCLDPAGSTPPSLSPIVDNISRRLRRRPLSERSTASQLSRLNGKQHRRQLLGLHLEKASQITSLHSKTRPPRISRLLTNASLRYAMPSGARATLTSLVSG